MKPNKLTDEQTSRLSGLAGNFKGAIDFLTDTWELMPPPAELLADRHNPELWRTYFASLCKKCLNQLQPDRN